MTAKPLVIYHYPCVDGFTAAWAIWLEHPDWEFYGAKHGDPAPDVTGRTVYMVDFSYKRPVILEMAKVAEYIHIIDHHKTAEADLVNLPFNVGVHFDMEKSGAQLTWERFHVGKEQPALVSYVADRDLWRFKYPATEAIGAYIFSKDYSFENWNRLSDEIGYQFEHAVDKGAAITAKHHKDIQELSALKFRTCIAGYEVPVANVPYTLASDMGHLLGKGEPFAATFFYDGEGFVFSLRSDDDGVDVSEVAKKFGGGGHKHAAGFKIKCPLLRMGEVWEELNA